jgi:hypothetical protein
MDITQVAAAGIDIFPGYWRYVAQAALTVGITVMLDGGVRVLWARWRGSCLARLPWARPSEGRVMVGLSGLTFAWLPMTQAADDCLLAKPARAGANAGLIVYRLVVWQ